MLAQPKLRKLRMAETFKAETLMTLMTERERPKRGAQVSSESRENFFSLLIPFEIAFSKFKELIKFQAIMQIRRYLQVDDLCQWFIACSSHDFWIFLVFNCFTYTELRIESRQFCPEFNGFHFSMLPRGMPVRWRCTERMASGCQLPVPATRRTRVHGTIRIWTLPGTCSPVCVRLPGMRQLALETFDKLETSCLFTKKFRHD